MGTGIKKINKLIREARLPEVEYRFSTFFTAQFTRVPFTGPPITTRVNEGVKFLLDYIGNNPGHRIPKISNEMKVEKKTLERWVKKLR